MKRLLILFLAVALTACGAVAPLQFPAPPTTVATLLVTVIVTQPLPPTAIPSVTSFPTPIPTQAAAAPLPTDTTVPPLPATSAPLTSGLFTDITRSSDSFYLRCAPTEIIFNVTSTSPYIVMAELYYRMQDKQSIEISEWKNAGAMDTDDQVAYTFTLEALDVHPDLRFVRGWLDYQFVGYNKYGDVVSRTERFVQRMSFARDCP